MEEDKLQNQNEASISSTSEDLQEHSIDYLLKEGRLREALDRFGAFFLRCKEANSTFSLIRGRLASLENQEVVQAIGREAGALETNKIRLDFQTELIEFREKTLSHFFDIEGQAEFLHSITDRDQVVHEILDLRLLPKRYQRDKNWEKLEGNSSIVYRLQHTDTQRHAIAMVIKMPTLEEGLKTEIKRLTDLRHRNIIKLIDHEIDRFPYFVITEYVYGENLPDALETVGPRTPAQTADWLYQLADALDYLRHKRILHTNVRPSKIYLDDEWQIMISPFDLIKATSNKTRKGPVADPSKDNPGERTFTRYRDVCQYASPELFARDGEGFDDSDSMRTLDQMCVSDMYSLGLVAYMMLTGKDLFEGKRIYEILESRRDFEQDAAVRAEKLAKLPPGKLTVLVLKLLEQDPRKRAEHFKDLRQLVHALNPLTLAEHTGASEARKSYRRCLANNREFIRDFYQSFIENSPHKDDFTDMVRKRQSIMLQMAVDVIIDVDDREDLLVNMVKPSDKHPARYSYQDFEKFIDTLLEMVEIYDRDWNVVVKAEWKRVRDKSLEVIRKYRS